MGIEQMNDNTEASVIRRLVTEETTSKITNLQQLWLLSREVRDTIGDPVWNALFEMGYSPRPVSDIGYEFEHDGLTYIYFTRRATGSRSLVRFAIPRLVSGATVGTPALQQAVNHTNAMASECKATAVDSEVWLIYERAQPASEDLRPMLPHILGRLKSAAVLFRESLRV